MATGRRVMRHIGRRASALNAKRLEKPQTKRCLGAAKISKRSVKETRMTLNWAEEFRLNWQNSSVSTGRQI